MQNWKQIDRIIALMKSLRWLVKNSQEMPYIRVVSPSGPHYSLPVLLVTSISLVLYNTEADSLFSPVLHNARYSFTWPVVKFLIILGCLNLFSVLKRPARSRNVKYFGTLRWISRLFIVFASVDSRQPSWKTRTLHNVKPKILLAIFCHPLCKNVPFKSYGTSLKESTIYFSIREDGGNL